MVSQVPRRGPAITIDWCNLFGVFFEKRVPNQA